MTLSINKDLKRESQYQLKFTKTEYLNAKISGLLKKDVSEQIRERKMSLEMLWYWVYPPKLKDILRKAKKIYDEYKIVSPEEIRIGDIDFRFSICFLKYNNFAFEEIEKVITKQYKHFKEEIENEIDSDINLALTKIYSILTKLTKKNFKKWNLRSSESGLDQLSYKWYFLGGRKIELTFNLDRLSEMKRFYLMMYKENKQKNKRK